MIAIEYMAGLLPGPLRPAAMQFAGYVLVSGAAFCVDFSIYWMLLKPVQFAALAAVGGYVAGVVVHYFLSSRIVFARQLQARGVASEAPVVAKFFAAGGTGLVVTALCVGILADGMGVAPLLAKLVATGMSFVCVFSALRFFVFNAAHDAPAAV